MRVGVLLTALPIVLAIGLLGVLALLPLAPFEIAIEAALDGTPESTDPALRLVCSGFDCATVLPQLPPVSEVTCAQPLVGRDLRVASLGACCTASFGDLGSTEIHVFRDGAGYVISLTEPRMRRVIRTLTDRAR